MYVTGAPSSAPRERIAKKLVVRLCQSTFRRLITSASTVTPCTSNASVPPMETPRCFAAASSRETRGVRAASAAVHQRPRVIAVPGGGSAVAVSTYSRVRYQTASGAAVFFASISARVTGVPSMAASRPRMTGVRTGATPPLAAATRRRNGSA